jgi:hypothetical protein
MKPSNGKKCLPNLPLISLLSTTGKLFQKLILRTIEKHTEERNLLNAREFGFRTDQSKTLQCMKLTNYSSLNFNNNISTAAVFLVIEKAFDTLCPTI